jgi:hypothetical protein
LADVVAVVTAGTLRTDVDPEQRHTYRLIVHVDRVLYGEHVGTELELIVTENAGGFASVDENERQILNQQFLVFIKWARVDRVTRARWHLSPATDQVASRVRDTLLRIHRVRPDTEHHRVIIHRG